jgi:hypothetical protein
MMVGVTLVVAVVLVVGVTAFLPDDGSVSIRPEADFTVERDDGALVVDPQYMTEGVPFTLLINGREVYTWEGGNTERERELRCLNADDAVYIRAETEGQRTYLIEKHDVEGQTDCGLSGTASRFAYAQVGDRQVPLEDSDYSFTLAIDPDGPNSVNGDTDYPTTNPWNYVQRYDRTVEGLSGPVYVVVFADNVADWNAEPSGTPGEDAFTVDTNGDLTVTPSGSEPTNDLYLIFKPGCDESEFKYIDQDAAYNNQVLLDGSELFRSDDASEGTTYTGPGVDCT